MKCENKVGKEFDSLSQRLVYSYMISYSKFIQANIDEITVEAQKQTHSFIGSLLYKIYNNPALIGLSLEKDDCFHAEAFKDRPELAKSMKNLEKKFLGFFDFIFELGVVGELKDNTLYIPNTKMKIQKNKLTILDKINLKNEMKSDGTIIYSVEYPELCSGWKFLSKICKLIDGRDIPNRITKQCMAREMFMKCLFDLNNISLDRLYGDLEQSGVYLKELEDYFISNGYENNVYFALRKVYPNKQDGSFFISFDWRRKNQLTYCIDVPSLAVLMEHFNEMNHELQKLIFIRTNTCNLCGYCAQTGKRKIVAVQLKNNGETINKCPYYPNFGWDSLNEQTASTIKNFCNFFDDILYGK